MYKSDRTASKCIHYIMLHDKFQYKNKNKFPVPVCDIRLVELLTYPSM
jgi:hypothetical protein